MKDPLLNEILIKTLMVILSKYCKISKKKKKKSSFGPFFGYMLLRKRNFLASMYMI